MVSPPVSSSRREYGETSGRVGSEMDVVQVAGEGEEQEQEQEQEQEKEKEKDKEKEQEQDVESAAPGQVVPDLLSLWLGVPAVLASLSAHCSSGAPLPDSQVGSVVIIPA